MTQIQEYFSEGELEELRSIFFSEAQEILDELQDSLLNLENKPEDEESLKSLQRSLHTLKGDSLSMGFENIGILCHRAEDVLKAFKESAGGIDAGALGLLLFCKDSLFRLLEAAKSGQEGGGLEEVLKRIDDFLGAASLPEKGSEGDRDDVLSEYEERQVREAHSQGLKVYRADIEFDLLCLERAVGSLMLNERLEKQGQTLFTRPDIHGDAIEEAKGVTVFFTADGEPGALEKVLSLAGVTAKVAVSLLPRDEERREEVGEKAPAAGRLTSEMLRIQASKVDRIMNLVGELIINRSIIEQISQDAEEHEGDGFAQRLQTASAAMERTISDLQRDVMNMRMVPVEQIFRKFRRTVGGLATQRGRDVRLELQGKETELDKGIVDVLGEPLLHIIRNAVDHGLEKPEERLAEGKEKEGVVTLRAYHEAAQIVIEVSDDGRGISLENLKEKARRDGRLSPEECGRLSDREAADLIFLSGLSTAEEVSDVSGRGVGMDAVKEAVGQMKGSIEVETERGRGTTFRIRLPLTLAVIRSLLIRVGSRSYAIPISSVAEVVRVRAEEIQTVGGQATIVLREKSISCIDLHEIFGAPADEGRRFVLILTLGDRRVGLPVDQLLGQQELVIKAVDRQYVAADLVKGASILGDGSVIFILDIPALFRRAVEFVRSEKEKVQA